MKSEKRVKQKTIKDKLVKAQVLFGVVILVGILVSFLQGREYFAQRNAINEGNSRLINLQRTTAKALTSFNDFMATIDKNRFKEKEALEVIFPTAENYTGLTKELERYVLAINSVDSPIFLSNINYGSTQRGKENLDYEILPVTLSVSASEENFKKLLEYIYLSGDLNNKVRLMDINSVSFNVDNSRDLTGFGAKLLNANLSLNAYYKKTVKE